MYAVTATARQKSKATTRRIQITRGSCSYDVPGCKGAGSDADRAAHRRARKDTRMFPHQSSSSDNDVVFAKLKLAKFAQLTASEARAELPDAISRVAFGGERIIIGRHGKALVALVSLADLELLRSFEDAADLAAAKKSLKARGKSIPYAQARKSLGLK